MVQESIQETEDEGCRSSGSELVDSCERFYFPHGCKYYEGTIRRLLKRGYSRNIREWESFPCGYCRRCCPRDQFPKSELKRFRKANEGVAHGETREMCFRLRCAKCDETEEEILEVEEAESGEVAPPDVASADKVHCSEETMSMWQSEDVAKAVEAFFS